MQHYAILDQWYMISLYTLIIIIVIGWMTNVRFFKIILNPITFIMNHFKQ